MTANHTKHVLGYFQLQPREQKGSRSPLSVEFLYWIKHIISKIQKIYVVPNTHAVRQWVVFTLCKTRKCVNV